MPYMKSAKKEAVGENIRTFRGEGFPERQAIAMSLSVQRRAKKDKRSGGDRRKNLGKFLHSAAKKETD